MITVAALHIYPVKALGGVALDEAELTDRGFAGDRRFMVVDERGRFLTQRKHPRMALVAAALDERALTLRYGDRPPLVVPRLPDGESREVQVWDDRVAARSAGPEAARWLSDVLGVPCELVHQPESTLRSSSAKYAPTSAVSFADAFPYLLCTHASLAELARNGADVPMDRFRPNLVVDGNEPFEEDRWARLRVGDVAFHLVKPCARCVGTTVDQRTGATGREPLATLARLRKRGNDVLFGWNLVAEGRGRVRVGDRVEVVSRP